ncbi:MAG: glycosyltransferase family 4 protein [Alphaproteobacteria bacterium]|nr:glycosyltransferase family 4 protein [Alphaproteobacteria bacterium]
MRILYSHRVQSRDGQSVHIEALVSALRAAGHEVRVVGPGFYNPNDLGGESRAIARVRALLPAWLQEAMELAYNVPAYRRLRRASDSFEPDLIYERYNLYFLAGAWLARRRGLPFYLEVNAPIAEERTEHSGLRLRRLARALERRVWFAADRILAVTAVLKDGIAGKGVDPARIAVIPNGIDPASFPGPAQSSEVRDPVVLGFVGFVRPWHGLDAVIAALAAYEGPPSVRLVIVGDGPARADLEAQADALGMRDRVGFTGIASREEIPGIVTGFDIALQPRVVAYASPLKVFEYMAAGRAIVAPDQPNIREILRHEETALLFDPAAPGALWQAIERLVHDPSLRARLGAAAHGEILRRNYTWPGNAERVGAMARADLATRRGRVATAG